MVSSSEDWMATAPAIEVVEVVVGLLAPERDPALLFEVSRGRLEQAQVSNAITLPQQAVTRTQQGDTVSVVGEDGKVSQRTIKVSAAQNNRWVVLEGLKAEEKIMVDGFQKLQMLPPGTPVKPVPWQAPGAPSARAATPAASAASASKP